MIPVGAWSRHFLQEMWILFSLLLALDMVLKWKQSMASAVQRHAEQIRALVRAALARTHHLHSNQKQQPTLINYNKRHQATVSKSKDASPTKMEQKEEASSRL